MVSIKWCCKQKEGINLVDPNDNLSEAYMKMAEASLGTMGREKNYNLAFAISACYYSMYSSLYSVLIKIGVKCEIHSCTLEFMKKFLLELYSNEDYSMIKKAFNLRIIAQYYIEKVIDKEDSDFIISKAPLFFNKTKEVLSKINEDNILEIKKELKGEMFNG